VRAVSGQAVARYDAVHMEMLGQRLLSGVEDGRDAQLGSQMLRIPGKLR
jgi:hypothetical protein